MATARPPITCHVLDTTIGKPAANIPVTLSLRLSSSSTVSGGESNNSTTSASYLGTTNADGRVTEWGTVSAMGRGKTLEKIFEGTEGEMAWTLTFTTGEYWGQKGVKPFFPEVTIGFVTNGFANVKEGEREHWHVPLLLGPYNYTTYRGS